MCISFIKLETKFHTLNNILKLAAQGGGHKFCIAVANKTFHLIQQGKFI